jgi:nitrate reductase NapD
MNICGILVHTQPSGIDIMKERLTALPGVEVHGVNDDGRMVVTLEEDEEDTLADAMLSIQRMEGVISASMIYHHCEEENEAITEEVSL